jgi:endo-alpha-N-acetylgalactosaminidase
VVFYGTTSGSYTNSVDVGNTTTWSTTTLTAGRQYFVAVLAYDANGRRGPLSVELAVRPYETATVVAPLPGSTLSTASAPFQWSAGSGVSQYRLSVGTAAGGATLFDQTTAKTAATVTGLPATGPVFVRLWSLVGATWHFTDYSYTALRPTISIANATVMEGLTGTTTMTFPVTLTPAAATAVTVSYATANGTATAGSDYLATSGTLTIPAGAKTAAINVAITGDAVSEGDETILVKLTNVSANAALGAGQATGTIRNDDSAKETTSYLSDRTWTAMTNGWGPAQKDRSNGEDGAADGLPLTLNGVAYAKGLGAHAASDIRYALNGACSAMTALVGVDDEAGGANGSIVFQVWTDGVKKYDSGMMTGATATASVSVDVTGAMELALIITDAGNGIAYDHGDWASAQVRCGVAPAASTVTSVSPVQGTTRVAVGTNITATFAGAISAPTLTAATMTLVPQGSTTAVAASITYVSASRTVTLDPTANLMVNTVYTVTLKGGAAGVKDLAGNAMAADKVWTFTTAPAPTTAFLSDRAWTTMTNEYGPVEKDRSNGEDGAADGLPLTLNGVIYAKGLGAHAPSDIRYALNGACSVMTALVGVDDEAGGSNGSIVFQVWADGVKKYDSGVMTGTTATASVSVNVAGAKELALIMTDGGDWIAYDHGDWANAQVTCTAP